MADLAATARARLVRQCDLMAAVAVSEIPEQVTLLAHHVVSSVRSGSKVLFFGNGGSSADASHLAGELVGRLRYERAAVPALSLGDQLAAITAVGNDFGFDEVFARGIEAFGQSGDLAIALTTSGRSANVLRGLEIARKRGLHTTMFTGLGVADILADVVVQIPSTDTQEIQEMTMHLGHTLCELVESALRAVGPE
jgi:D-sedoheptulose 7-phosphate isomerase